MSTLFMKLHNTETMANGMFGQIKKSYFKDIGICFIIESNYIKLEWVALKVKLLTFIIVFPLLQ